MAVKKEKPLKLTILEICCFIVVMIVITILAMPYIRQIANVEGQRQFREDVISLGIFGWIIVFAIQFIQVLVAFIPGEPIEILAGVMYGGFGGIIICSIGCIAASTVVFLLSKRFGSPLVENLFSNGKLKKYKFLKDSKKLEQIVFILFLIPGTPKDMLTYVVGTTSMSLSEFLVITTIARIPSVISSTFMGATAIRGEWKIALAIFIFTAMFGIAGIKWKESVISWCKRIGERIQNKTKKVSDNK